MASRVRFFVSSSALVAVLAAIVAPSTAQAQDAVAGDVKRGQALSYTCNGCHAIPNYKNVYPTYSVPKLRGQRPEYLVAAMKAYKSGERSHGTMHAQAISMNEQDMADIAAYLAGPSVPTESKSDAPAANRPKSSETCVPCHGSNGIGIDPTFPTIAGQHRDYLARALVDYKKGGRKNAIMAAPSATLTEKDVAELAAYYSSLPGLETVRKNQFVAK